MEKQIVAGSDFENFQMKVTEKDTGNEIAFQDFDNVYVTLVDEHGVEVAKYDTAGNNNPLALVDTTGSGDKETLQIDLFGEDTKGYTRDNKIYANIDVEYSSRAGYSGSPAYKRLYNSKHIINLEVRL